MNQLMLGLAMTLTAPTLPDKLKGKEAIEEVWESVLAKDGTPKVDVEDSGVVSVRDRGMLISRKTHGPVSVTFRLKWAEGDGRVAEFRDHLGIGFRMPGPPGPKVNDNVMEGLVVSLFSSGDGGKVVIDVRRAQGGGGTIREIADQPVPLKRGVEYVVQVVDEGDVVRVVLDGKEVTRGRVANAKDFISERVAAGRGQVAVFSRGGRDSPTKSVVRDLRVVGNGK